MALSPNTLQKMQSYLGREAANTDDVGILGQTEATQDTGILGSSSASALMSSPSPSVTINSDPTKSATTTNSTKAIWSGTGTRPADDPGPSGPDPGNMWDSPGARAARGLPPLASQAASTTTPPQTYGSYNDYNLAANPPAMNLPQNNSPSTYAIGGVNYGLPPPPSTGNAATGATGNAVTGTASTSTSAPGTPPQGILNANGSTTINSAALTNRIIDPATETGQGQMNSLLAKNSDYVQGFRDRTQREANARGLSNSTLAGTGGEEAAARAALDIASLDAAIYGKASDYNTALQNQALMYNVNTQNEYQLQTNTIDGQKAIAAIGAAATMGAAGIAASARLSEAHLNAEFNRWNAQLQDDRSRYNTDMNYKAQQDQNRTTLINNIMNNMEMDPKIKSGQLNALGEFALGKAIYPDPELDFSGDSSNQVGDTRNLGGKIQRWNGTNWAPIVN